MKRLISIVALLALSLTLLVGCGSANTPDSGSAGEEAIDLNAFFTKLEGRFEWEEGTFMDLDEETFAATYPGIEQYNFVQKVAKMPMMTAVVNEFVFLECETEEDADAVAQILKDRVLLQAEGGAWYPESMAAWGEAHVLPQGRFVAMIASGDQQNAIEMAWNKLFGK